jgi:hypothetical protein
MSDEQRTENMRYELGREARQKGERLHEGASEEFRHGYMDGKDPGSVFGPKPTPIDDSADWTCVCGHVNPGRKRLLVAKRVVCWECGLEKDIALQVQADEKGE